MNIEWLGHAAFLITSEKETKIITDPYQSGSYGGAIAYEPIKISADIVTISHSHPDHSYSASITGNPQIINSAGKYAIKDIRIKGINSFHDNQKGGLRGKNIIFVLNVDGINIAHLGDLGHQLDQSSIKDLEEVDILLIPTGGSATIGPKEADALINNIKPKIAIPMHFKTDKIGFNFEPLDSFLRNTKFAFKKENSASIKINRVDLGKDTRIVVLLNSH